MRENKQEAGIIKYQINKIFTKYDWSIFFTLQKDPKGVDIQLYHHLFVILNLKKNVRLFLKVHISYSKVDDFFSLFYYCNTEFSLSTTTKWHNYMQACTLSNNTIMLRGFHFLSLVPSLCVSLTYYIMGFNSPPKTWKISDSPGPSIPNTSIQREI